MIRLAHMVLPSQEQMEFVIEGMRNPMNSWDKSDSVFGCAGIDITDCKEIYRHDCKNCSEWILGSNDINLMQKLSIAGTEHRKHIRMMPVMVRITAPLYWWKEFDTYKIGTVANSCSTMHKIQAKEFTIDDFSCEHLCGGARNVLKLVIEELNTWRDLFLQSKNKDDWWQMIQLLPSSYNQTRNVMLNYEVLANIYKQRKTHKLDEWIKFCKWIETLPYSELITGNQNEK